MWMQSDIGQYHGHIETVHTVLRRAWTLISASRGRVSAHNIKSQESVWDWTRDGINEIVLGRREVFVGTEEGHVIALDGKSGTVTWQSTVTNKHAAKITCLVYSSEHSMLLSGAADREIKYWDSSGNIAGKAALSLVDPAHPPRVTCMCFVPAGFVAGAEDGTLRCFALDATRSQPWERVQHTRVVYEKDDIVVSDEVAAQAVEAEAPPPMPVALSLTRSVSRSHGPGAATRADGASSVDGSSTPGAAGGRLRGAPAVPAVGVGYHNGKVVMALADGRIHAFAAENGNTLWKRRIRDAVGDDIPTPCPDLQFFNDHVVCGWSDGCIRAFDMSKEGRPTWTLSPSGINRVSRLVVDVRGVLVVTSVTDRTAVGFDIPALANHSAADPVLGAGTAESAQVNVEWPVGTTTRAVVYSDDEETGPFAQKWEVRKAAAKFEHTHVPESVTCICVAVAQKAPLAAKARSSRVTPESDANLESGRSEAKAAPGAAAAAQSRAAGAGTTSSRAELPSTVVITGHAFANAIESGASRMALARGATSTAVIANKGDTQPTIRASDPSKNQVLWEEVGHSGWIRGVAVDIQTGQVYSASDDFSIAGWKLENGNQLWMKPVHRGPVASLSFDPCRKELVSGSFDETLRNFDVTTPDVKMRWRVEGHSDGVTCIANSTKRGVVISGSADFTVRCWNVRTGAHRWTAFAHQGIVSCVTVDDRRDVVLSGSADKTVRTWSLKGGHAAGNTITVSSGVVGVAVDARHVYVQTGSTIGVYENRAHRLRFIVDPDMSPMTCLSLVSDDAGNPYTIFCGGSEGEVLSIDVRRRLKWHGTEVIHNLHKEKEQLDRFLAEYNPVIDFWISLAVILIDFFQMTAFAFQGPPAPSQFKSTQQALEGVQFFGTDIDYGVVFIICCIVVGLFTIAFFVQERVEKRFFLHPESTGWKIGWLLMTIGTRVVATSAFLPIMKILAEAGDCDFATMTWEAVEGAECLSGQHTVYLLTSLLLVLIYAPLCVRFFRVGGKLNAIEASWNMWDWSRDDTETRRRLHVLSFKDNSYLMFTVLIKAMLTGSSVYLTNQEKYGVVVGVFKVVCGILMLCVGIYIKPFFEAPANRLRSTLDAGLLWTYICGCIAVIWTETENMSEKEKEDRSTVLSLLPALTLIVLVLGAIGQGLVAGCSRRQNEQRLAVRSAGKHDYDIV